MTRKSVVPNSRSSAGAPHTVAPRARYPSNSGGSEPLPAEPERGAVVVIAVEHQPEPVGVAERHVATAEPGRDALGQEVAEGVESFQHAGAGK